MTWGKLIRRLLFPHPVIMVVLLPIATALLVYAMVFWGTESVAAILTYVLAAYTLTVWCVKIPHFVRFFQRFKQQNPYAKRWLTDPQLRIHVSLCSSLVWNIAYAAFQLGLGIIHRTVWFCSLAGYYVLLAGMRFFLVRHTGRQHQVGENRAAELRKYRACGIVFLVMNVALTVIVFFMVYWNRSFHHHEITTIAMAAYTFTSFTLAIISIIKYRRYHQPVYTASKTISLAAACVSMLTLTATMLTTFGGEGMDMTMRRMLLGIVGGGVSICIITMAIYMIIQGTRQLRQINTTRE